MDYLERPSIALPLTIVAIGVLLLAPRMFSNEPAPAHDFLYALKNIPATMPSEDVSSTTLNNGFLIFPEKRTSVIQEGEKSIRVFRYNVARNESIEIPIETIGAYDVRSGTLGPDGYLFVRLEPSLLDFHRQPRYALVKGTARHIVKIKPPENEPTQEVLFLGWIK